MRVHRKDIASDVVNGQVSKKLCQIIGRVHIPAESIHTAGRVYRHFGHSQR